jgi:glycosyltransferase involved in cell wall biosynthesis
MHVCYLITRSEMGGSQTHVLDLVRGFRDRFQITLITGEEGFLTDQSRRLGIDIRVVPNLVQPLRPHQDFRAFRELAVLLRRLRPDLLHCHTSKAGVIGRLAARTTGVRALFTAHTWSFADGTSRLWKLVGTPSERLAARWTEKIITVSDSNRALALQKQIAGAEKLITVHNGISDTKHRARPGRQEIPRIVMVARFAPQKNQQQLLEALAELRNLPFHLTFVGDGPTRGSVENTARQLQLQDRVSFLGTRMDTEQILSESSIFVLATNWEGFPITILEAMRAGLPVVATDVDGVREAVNDGVTGFLVPRNDTPALRERIRLLLNDATLRANMGAAGRKAYESEFTVAAMLRKIEAVYASALREHSFEEETVQAF